MTQKSLIIEYIKEFGSILPAKISGEVYKGVMFGSETSKRCRELRKEGKLDSSPDGKFEKFYLAKKKETVQSVSERYYRENGFAEKKEEKGNTPIIVGGITFEPFPDLSIRKNVENKQTLF